MRDGIALAGLEVNHIIEESIAVVHSYLPSPHSINQTFLVIDVGGGTCDASLVTFGENVSLQVSWINAESN